MNDYWVAYRSQFRGWLSSRIAKSTMKDYISALEKFFSRHQIKDIKHLRTAIEKENYNSKLVKGLRNFINFLAEEEIIDDGSAALLKKPLKLKQSKPRQVFISEEEIREAYRELTKYYGYEAEVLLKLLVFTGLRLKQIVQMLNEYDPGKLVIVNGKVARYPMMEYSKSTKRAFWAYMPSDFAKSLKRINITYYQAQPRTTYGRVSASTIRKWFSTFLARHKVPVEIIDFIQGRAQRSIIERHYLNLTVLADEAYSRVVDSLKKVLEGGGDGS
ncbi:integrase [Pyrococcus kukulkanii]|uniref:Integrase n=1 Tax=Pyrococcus kukulkanii TaxID=1609559 RepID=A0ABV4T6L2_9EURY